MKKIVGCQLMIDNLQVWYNNGDCKHIKKSDLLNAIQLMDDFEFLKDEFGINCLVKKSNKDKSLLHLLKDAQQVILSNCELIEAYHESKNLTEFTTQIKNALRHFKK